MSGVPLDNSPLVTSDWLVLPAALDDAVGEPGDFIWTDLTGMEHRERFVLERHDSELKAFKRRVLLSMPPFPILYCRDGVLHAVSNRLTSVTDLGEVAAHLCMLTPDSTAPIRLELGDGMFGWTSTGGIVEDARFGYQCSEGLVLGLCGPKGYACRGQLLPTPWTTAAGD